VRDELREAFVGAMGRIVSSVTIVTTDGAAGRYGVTVSAMTSVSADPPLLLTCINRKSPAAAAIGRNRVLGVNVLACHQLEVAQTFAGRPQRGAAFDFDVARWQFHVTGAPILRDAIAAFDCALRDRHEAGTHLVLIGEVLEALAGPGEPLLYGRRAFARPERLLP
jgi:flavin reductase